MAGSADGRVRTVVTWLLVLLVGFALLVCLLWIFQRRLIYLPDQAVPPPGTVALPDLEEVSLTTEDGLMISAWFVPGNRRSRGAVIVFNGNAGNRSYRTPLASALSADGYSVLLVDYRGYGGNPGSPSESGLAADARAAREYLQSRPDVDIDRLAYFGESLGAGVALGLADEVPPSALVLRSPFTSLPDIGSVHYPFLPTSLLLWDRYPNLERIDDLEVPVLVIAGSADGIVPVDQSRQVYEAAREPKRLLVIEGAGHNDRALLAGDEMIAAVVSFLEDHL